jgi:hypothetical protein
VLEKQLDQEELMSEKKHYRAMISVPITADTDEAAEHQAAVYANSLAAPGSNVIVGHLELVTEVDGGLMSPPVRVVTEDPSFRRQVPLVQA